MLKDAVPLNPDWVRIIGGTVLSHPIPIQLRQAHCNDATNVCVTHGEWDGEEVVGGEAVVVVDDLLVDPGGGGHGHGVPGLHQHRLPTHISAVI